MSTLVLLGAGVARAENVSASPTIPQPTPGASASADGEGTNLPEIIVTANKRSESINKVGLSITAVTGQALIDAGVTSPADLVKLVPGFFFQRSIYGTPVYTLRAVGFTDTALGGTPAVSVYLNQVPVPYTAMTLGTTLDIARVEVVKGPQGVLFGSNSTGGAINYLVNEPTSELHAGGSVGYSSYNLFEGEAYVSGPLSETLRARIAVRAEEGGAWQRSLTRPGDKLGNADRLFGRALLDWTPDAKLSIRLSVNAWRDKSDTQAPQTYAIIPAVPGLAPAGLYAAFRPADDDPRAADWDPRKPFRKNNTYVQAAVRADYDIADTVKLTSISAYSHYDNDSLVDIDGTAYFGNTLRQTGTITSLFQEVRLDATLSDRATLLVGVNANRDTIRESDESDGNSSLFNLFLGDPESQIDTRLHTKVFSYAAFSKIDYRLTPELKLTAAARYTQDNRSAVSCSYDGGDGRLALLQTLLTGTLVQPGGCATATNNVPGPVAAKLDQNNVSWRAGAEWQVRPTALLYATINKGYKAGAFPASFALAASQLKPVPQEALLAYEVGAKLTLLDHHLQLNGALFYYDYTNKQIKGRVLVPPLGSLETLISVPKSTVRGGEIQAILTPIQGLSISSGASYADSRINNGTQLYNPYGTLVDASGEAFPGAPKWQVNNDISYEHPINASLIGFGGVAVNYTSATNSSFGNISTFAVPNYTLVDLRAGIETANGSWRVNAFARNVLDKYYYTSAILAIDTASRYTGMGRTIGATVSFKY